MRSANNVEFGMLKWFGWTLAAFACFTGCSTMNVSHTKAASAPVGKGDVITVILDHTFTSPEKAAKLEARLGACVKKALRKADCPVKFISSSELRRLMFPDIDVSEASENILSLASLPMSSEERQKIEALNFRYLVIVNEETSSQKELSDHMADIYTFGASVTKTTTISASIIDMKYGNDTNFVQINAQSKGFYGAFYLFVPIIVPPASESKACNCLGKEVASFISSGTANFSTEE